MEYVLIAGFFAVVGIVGDRIVRQNRIKRHAAWKRVSDELGATVTIGKDRFWKPVSDSIEWRDRNAVVFADIDSSGGSPNTSSTIHTRAQAYFMLDAGPNFSVWRKGFLSNLGSAIGLQDEVLGTDSAFDDMFVVKCKSPDETRAVWTPQAMELMREHLEAGVVHTTDGWISLKVRGMVDDPACMKAMLQVVGELANSDVCGLAALQSLPGATYRAPTGPWNERTAPAVELEISGAVVTLSPAYIDEDDEDDEGITTCAVTHGIRAGEFLDLVIGGHSEAELPAEAKKHADRAGAGRLVCEEGTASFTWSSIETDVERLQAGARLVAFFTSPAAEGAFR